MDYDQLIMFAEDHGLTIVYHRGDPPGRYYHTTRTISLDKALSPMEGRCVLAHELGHAHHGHEHDPRGGWAYRRQERQADEYAVDLLIEEELWRACEIIYASDIRAVAHELEITQAMVTACRAKWGRQRRQAGITDGIG